MVNFGPLTAKTGWGTPANFNGVLVLASLPCSDVAQRKSTKLCTMFGRLLSWYTICTFLGALAPNGILPGATFTLRSSLPFSCFGSVSLLHGTGASNAMSPVPRPTSVPRGILIHPAVWLQQTWAENWARAVPPFSGGGRDWVPSNTK